MAPSLVVGSSDVRQLLRSQDVGVTWIERKRVELALLCHLRSLDPDALHRASLVPEGCRRFQAVPVAGGAPPAPHPHLAASVVPTDESRTPFRCRGVRARPGIAELDTNPELPSRSNASCAASATASGSAILITPPMGPWRLEIVARGNATPTNAGDSDLMERGSLGRKFARISRGASQGRQSDQARSD